VFEALVVTLREGVEAALRNDRSGFIRLAAAGEPHDFEVCVNAQGSWDVLDPWGTAIPFPVVPPIPDDAEAAPTLVRRLVHLTKFRNLDRLINPDGKSPLFGKLAVEWVGSREPRKIRLGAGERAMLRIGNRSSQDLNVAAITMRADGSIQWGILGMERGSFLSLTGATTGGEGESRSFEVTARPLPEVARPLERIKLFGASRGVANFAWLELPTWNGLILPRPALRHDDPLEHLLAALAGEWPAQRKVVITGMSGREWTVESVELQVMP